MARKRWGPLTFRNLRKSKERRNFLLPEKGRRRLEQRGDKKERLGVTRRDAGKVARRRKRSSSAEGGSPEDLLPTRGKGTTQPPSPHSERKDEPEGQEKRSISFIASRPKKETPHQPEDLRANKEHCVPQFKGKWQGKGKSTKKNRSFLLERSPGPLRDVFDSGGIGRGANPQKLKLKKTGERATRKKREPLIYIKRKYTEKREDRGERRPTIPKTSEKTHMGKEGLTDTKHQAFHEGAGPREAGARSSDAAT